ncbi:transposase [Natribacillus halophilus]|nr:transposase [Natribacillus halophilus]
MIDQGFAATKTFDQTLLLLDRYFLTVPALKRWIQWNQSEDAHMHIVTQAKSNAVAYEAPPARKGGRGRPRKKGAVIKLKELLQTRASEFETATVTLYGKEETVHYLCLDLLWGKGLYQELRFVLVNHNGKLVILVSTDRTFAATDIIHLYGYRFKIEGTFREMKQAIGGFSYRFWSKAMPKLNRFRKKEEPHPLEQVVNEKDKENIRLMIKAVEGFVMCSCIAMGLLQLIAVHYSHRVPNFFFRYLRTPSKDIVSEATAMAYLHRSIFRMFARNPHLSITQIIQSKQETPDFEDDSLAS